MADEKNAVRFRYHDEIMSGLYAMLACQEEMHQEQRGINFRHIPPLFFTFLCVWSLQTPRH